MSTYVGAEQVLTDLYVEQRLSRPDIVADLNDISAGLGARVFQDYAPAGTDYPLIIFQCQSPPRDVRGVGPIRVMVDTLYVVKAVAQVNTYAPLAPIAKVIDRAMTNATGEAVEDGFVLTSVREDQFSLLEVDHGTQFRHLGGEYRIHAQAEQ